MSLILLSVLCLRSGNTLLRAIPQHIRRVLALVLDRDWDMTAAVEAIGSARRRTALGASSMREGKGTGDAPLSAI
ncbi:hypothetical protein [Chromobacterium sp. ASV23]|uniref:hypothetical protein n=1 Tax=Chromobacterium sp. ASV23 TaxID=2795110 RepID=UPI0018EB9038|nr:hypothetical protein [Chromobacterium sp. ASV23]